MPDRRWSDADRELVERAWRSTSGVRLDGIEMMISDAMRAADVLDALTAAGWRPARDYLPAASEALDRHTARVRAEAVDCLAELVTLKDGPRDADYERRKPLAWDRARAIARAHRTTPGDDHG